MTWRSDCPLLSLLFLPLPLPSTLTLLFPGSFLLYFLPCSVMVGLGCSVGLFFFGLYGLFFPWLVLNKTKSPRLHSGVVPCCVLLPHPIHLGSDDKNFAESAQTPCLLLLSSSILSTFCHPVSVSLFCPCLLVTALPASQYRLFDRWGRV